MTSLSTTSLDFLKSFLIFEPRKSLSIPVQNFILIRPLIHGVGGGGAFAPLSLKLCISKQPSLIRVKI